MSEPLRETKCGACGGAGTNGDSLCVACGGAGYDLAPMTPAAELEGLLDAVISADRDTPELSGEDVAVLRKRYDSTRAALLAYGERLRKDAREARQELKSVSHRRQDESVAYDAARILWVERAEAAEARAERLEKALRVCVGTLADRPMNAQYELDAAPAEAEGRAALASPSAGRE